MYPSVARLRGVEMDDGETVVGDLVVVPEGLDPERHHRPLAAGPEGWS